MIPRELAVAFVAVPKQRPTIALLGGVAHFVRRDVARLDLERWSSPLGSGWATTLEQTVLDLASHRYGWHLPERALDEAIAAAVPRLDGARLAELGRAQRQGAAVRRVLTLVEAS